jgi:hypothetical protein
MGKRHGINDVPQKQTIELSERDSTGKAVRRARAGHFASLSSQELARAPLCFLDISPEQSNHWCIFHQGTENHGL